MQAGSEGPGVVDQQRPRWRNGVAEAGWALGAIALGASLMPMVWVIAVLLGPVALVVGFAGTLEALTHRAVGLLGGLTGVAFGFLAVLVCIIRAAS